MAAKTSQTQTKRNNDVEARLTLLEYQHSDFKLIVMKALDRIEGKQDAAIRQIDTLQYVSQHEFDAYTKEASKTYVSAESIKSMKTLFWAIITASVLGLISLGIFVIQSLIKT